MPKSAFEPSIKDGLTFDDILLQPRFSEVLPRNVDLSTSFSKEISLKIPLLSAAMDTVTESEMAIALAQQGGIGVIHKNMPIERQALEVRAVKRAESWMIEDPFTVTPEMPLHDVVSLMDHYHCGGFPVIDTERKVLGIITSRDIMFEDNHNLAVKEVMTKNNLITAPKGTSINKARKILKQKKIEKLLIIDVKGCLAGLVTAKDIQKKLEHPDATVDERGRLRCAAAVGVSRNTEDRVSALIDAGVDAVVIDTAHAHSKSVVELARKLRKITSNIQFVIGNIGSKEAAKDILKLEPDAIKVGIGPGSICTTRVVAGIGVPQVSAIIECNTEAKAAKVPLIADGGIRYSGDIVKALAVGADSVMLGNLLAGTEESPGESILLEGRRFKIYRAMGSIDAMKQGSADRYFQEEAKKFVPEGIEGIVPYRGKVFEQIYQLTGGTKSGLGYVGAKNINQLRKRARFVKVSSAGLKESHPHDIRITKEAPNYELHRPR
ncbi:IMP dehydrogenase [candidate division WOR-3 bacterium]|uniref:Inosine-5'-monophosphate dehydrogenase n=1 Tax=candidate division WOR-3 bacterium TaxID=2052148 RepID=A0A9D5KD27_UNCW3|nr:IMP dehydrogenase [candidate division WOR-3 bacterium]MBD3365391.1 IMP dehydrogenase [candidate division WOR-3 bacterium]